MWMAWLYAAHAAGCDQDALRQALEQTETAMEALDAEALAQGARDARSASECAAEPVGPLLAARLYRALGVNAFVAERQPDDAKAWFRATRLADPALTLPASLAGPVQSTFDASSTGQEVRRPVEPMPRTWTLQVDGRPTTTVPTERPYLMQWVGEGGVTTRLVDGLSPLPAPADPPEAPPENVRKPRGDGPRVPLLVASGVSAGLAVACLGGSLAQNGIMKSATDEQTLNAAYGRQKVFATGFWVFTAGGVGLGVGGVL